MKFTPRTDLERIVDQMNSISYNKNYSKIISNQLKRLGLRTKKAPKLKVNSNSNSESESSDNNNSDENDEESTNTKQIINKEKSTSNNNSLNPKISHSNGFKIKVISQEIKEIMKDYHKKTHFKGATQYIEELQLSKIKSEKNLFKYKIKRDNKINLKSNSSSLGRKEVDNINQILLKKKITKKDIEAQLANSCLSDILEKYPMTPENSDIVLSNPFLYENSMQFNSSASSIIVNEEKKSYLKRLILSPQPYLKKKDSIVNFKTNSQEIVKNYSISNNKKNKNKNKLFDSKNNIPFSIHDKIINIDGELIPSYQIEKIAFKMFRKCNYIHDKKPSIKEKKV